MAQISTATITANRFKDIQDKLFEITGTGTAFQDICKVRKIADSNTFWTEKKYSTGSSNTSQVAEGTSTFTGETPLTMTTYSNYAEQNKFILDITDRMKAVARNGGTAGVKDLRKSAINDCSVELKARCERSYLNGTKDAGVTGSIPSKMNGINTMAQTYGSTQYTSDTSWGASAEVDFRTFLGTVFNAGGIQRYKGKAFILMSYATKDKIVAGFTGVVDPTYNINENKPGFLGDIEFYKSQYGTLMFMPHVAQADNKLVAFEAPDCTIGVLSATYPAEQGRSGDSEKVGFLNDTTFIYDRPSTLGYMYAS